MMGAHLSICDVNPWITRAFERAFLGVQTVTVICGDILNQPSDAVATPGNSYGVMDGGIDKVFRDAFSGAENLVRQAISERPLRELLVGEALSVPVSADNVRVLIYAPTMRVPRPIADPYDIRLAVRAVFQESRRLGCSRLLMPAFGTLSGRVDFDVAAAAFATEWAAQ